ncbi:MAG TPA: SGNH/GDSL hydrolase family protein [Burkholderiales bacterium]|nr:SGNH/GDSL hydrolase family protein [Burkholderiales bacterium]
MPHLILLGDSIFDNVSYTAGGPDVTAQVRRLLPSDWGLSLLAVDGNFTSDVENQLAGLPADATHLVISIGGNDILMHAGVLDLLASTTAHAVGILAGEKEKFENAYRAAIGHCLRLELPLTVCTVYNGSFPEQGYQRILSTALAIFNDVILRVAIEHGLPVIDLRSICRNPEDYANPIEPSSIGGDKIAHAIVGVVTGSGIGKSASIYRQ